MGLRCVRVDRKRLLKMPNAFNAPAELAERNAQIGVRLRKAANASNRWSAHLSPLDL